MISEAVSHVVRPADVDAGDETFRVTTRQEVTGLCESLRAAGMTNPPLLLRRNDRLMVVCGFLRTRAAQALGWETMPVRILPESTGRLPCALAAIAENAGERALNPIEISRSAALLMDTAGDLETACRHANALGLSGNERHLVKMAGLCRMHRLVQEGLVSGAIALPTALSMAAMSASDAAALAELFRITRPSLGKQREMMTNACEISKREDLSVAAVLNTDDIRRVLYDGDMEAPRKTGLVRSYLKKRRFPAITRAEATFEALKNRLPLDPHTTLTPPPGFEGNRYTISFGVSNLGDFCRHQQTLFRIAEDPDFKTLLDT